MVHSVLVDFGKEVSVGPFLLYSAFWQDILKIEKQVPENIFDA